MRRPFACSLILLSLVTSIVLSTSAARSAEDLVGLVVGGKEVAILLVQREKGRFWLPLKEVAEQTNFEVRSNPGPVVVDTPLGEVTVPEGSIRKSNGVNYVDERFFKERLNFWLSHDSENGRIGLLPPWSRGEWQRADAAGLSAASDLQADVRPARFGFVTAHGTLAFETGASRDHYSSNILRLTGHAHGGVWQITYADDLDGNNDLRDVVWLRRRDDRAIQIGHQTVALHPLLDTREFTGVQAAWSSSGLGRASKRFTGGSLLSRRNGHRRTFEGTGPVGGFAELRIDGRRIARRNIRLDGVYSFTDIPLSTRQSQVEVRLFDRRNPRDPIDVLTETIVLSDLLLEAGDRSLVVGAGLAENTFDRFGFVDDTRTTGGGTGFAFSRAGVSENVTIEAGISADRHDQVALAGVIARLPFESFITASVGASASGALGYDFGLAVERTTWRLMVESFQDLRQEEQFKYQCCRSSVLRLDDGCSDHAYRVHSGRMSFLGWGRNIEFGLVGRADDRNQYILPYVSWRPDIRTSVWLAPGYDGTYRLDARRQLTPFDVLSATAVQDRAALTYAHNFRTIDLTLTATAGYDFYLKSPEGLLGLSGGHLGGFDVEWRAAVLYENRHIGFEGSLRRKLRPGVYGFITASTGGYGVDRDGWSNPVRNETRLRVGLDFDLAYAGGSLKAAPRFGVDPTTGSVSGRVAPLAASDNDLSGIPVLVDGRQMATTASDGSFFVSGVHVGNRVVTFEDDQLPIEHVPEARKVVAEVAAGAITDMTFQTRVVYGAAGRVTGPDGNGISDVEVAVLAGDGAQLSSTRTNQFGHWRTDELPPGKYTVQVAGNTPHAPTISRPLTITNDYEFGVDIQL